MMYSKTNRRLRPRKGWRLLHSSRDGLTCAPRAGLHETPRCPEFGCARGLRGVCVFVVCLLVFFGEAAHAESFSESTESPASGLSVKQEMVLDQVQRLEDRMFRLQELLAKTEPEQAARLERALDRLGQLDLEHRLEVISGLLGSEAQLMQAVEAQTAWMNDLEQVLGILLEREGNNEDRDRQIEKLEALREQVRSLREAQQRLRDATARQQGAARLAEALDRALQQLDQIAQAQRAQTRAREDADPDEQERLAERVGDLAEATEQWSAEAAPRDPQAGAAEGTPEDPAPSGDQGQSPSQEALPPGAQPPGSPSQNPSEPGSSAERLQQATEALREAKQAMVEAGSELQVGERDEARQAQQQAEEDLRRARDRLEEAREALAQQAQQQQREPEDQPGKPNAAGDQQRSLGEQAQELSDQLRQNGQQSGGGPSQQQQQDSADRVDQAEQHMQDAADLLEEDQAEQALEAQDRALQQLEAAEQKLDDTLAQKRREDRAEALRDLEGRFRDMLARQRRLNQQTEELAAVGADAFARAEELQLADMVVRERGLAERARTCLHILDEEGTTLVFPRMVEQVAEDMEAVAERLEAERVGAVTQQFEAEVIDSLEQLIEAVQRMQQENEQGGGPQPGQSPDDQSPLLPESAELKLLRAAQVRINKRTSIIEQARAEDPAGVGSLEPALSRAAARQREIAETAQEMRERTND
jgi:hypothetical protein